MGYFLTPWDNDGSTVSHIFQMVKYESLKLRNNKRCSGNPTGSIYGTPIFNKFQEIFYIPLLVCNIL